MQAQRKALLANIDDHLRHISHASKISEIREATHSFLIEIRHQLDIMLERQQSQEERLQYVETITKHLQNRVG